MLTTETIRLQSSQANEAISVLSEAFNQDPILQYLFSQQESERLKSLRWQSKIILEYCQPEQEIYTTAGTVKGVAIWLPPEQPSLNTLRLLQLGFIAFPLHVQLKRLMEYLSIFSKIEKYRQDMTRSHWYLMMLGVAPAYQNQGIGGSLLQPILQRADKDGIPCYLETSTEGGVRFYQRQGFEVLRSDRVAGGSLSFWTMKREPQAKGN